MAITIEIDGELAHLDHGGWQSADTELAHHLNEWTKILRPGPAEPWPAMYVAEQIVARIGGTIVSWDEPEPMPPGTVY